tara:strand:+ start:1416 stop:1634 length:219 start_codon:yes stop_codon:yes gene_type:complete
LHDSFIFANVILNERIQTTLSLERTTPRLIWCQVKSQKIVAEPLGATHAKKKKKKASFLLHFLSACGIVTTS